MSQNGSPQNSRQNGREFKLSKANGHHTSTEQSQLHSSPHQAPMPHVDKKYRHTTAIHTRPKTSVLSHDSDVAPSFLGFRNLMIIVLVVSNLRLMIENFIKVRQPIAKDCELKLTEEIVWCIDLHPMSRLPTSRRLPRHFPLPPSPLSPSRGLYNRTGGCETSARHCWKTEKSRLDRSIARAEAERASNISIDVATSCLFSRDQHHPLSVDHDIYSLFLYSPSPDRNTVHVSCSHRVAESLLLCLHQSRPSIHSSFSVQPETPS